MDVFLVPVASDRHQLYCEVPDEPREHHDEPPAGLFKRMKHRFSEMLAEAERERRHGHSERKHTGWTGRVRARTLRWVAEAVAEQRLLWHMRRQSAATLFYPDDTTEQAATEAMRREMTADYERHRRWLIIDSLAFIASGIFFFVPGPNIVAYYFAFRLVGHFFSVRGARQALDVVTWTAVSSPALAALRRAITLDGEARAERVASIAEELRLEHLARFVERTAAS